VIECHDRDAANLHPHLESRLDQRETAEKGRKALIRHEEARHPIALSVIWHREGRVARSGFVACA
jgi:hypothetical protein